jgi:hypothetical protein
MEFSRRTTWWSYSMRSDYFLLPKPSTSTRRSIPCCVTQLADTAHLIAGVLSRATA